MKLEDIARRLPGELSGRGDLEIAGIAHPEDATGRDLAVALADDVGLDGTAAQAAVVRPGRVDLPDDLAVLVYDGDPRLGLSGLTAMFDAGPVVGTGIHPTAVVADDAEIAEGVVLGPHAVVGPRSRIGAGTRILANVTVGADVVIGDGGLIHPGVAVGDRVVIGRRVIIHANAVLGGDGFSFVTPPPGQATGDDRFPRIHSLGTVVVEDDVEIGAGTTIDRATLRATRIGAGAKIDNQVQIGHNVTVGRAVVICGTAGVAGSSEIGDGAIIAAAVGVSDHVKVGESAVVLAMSGVNTDVPPGGVFLGYPAVPRNDWINRYASLGRLPRMIQKMRDLAKRVGDLEQGGGASGGKGETGATDD